MDAMDGWMDRSTAEMGDSELDLYLGFCERALLGEHEHEQRAAGEREGSGKCAHATQRNAHAVKWRS